MTATPSASDLPPGAGSFAYDAQSAEGLAVSGTIDAPDADSASRLLQTLRLRVLRMERVAPRPGRTAPLRGDDFLAFNQQLAHLTRAGLPVEHGLRLIAQDMRTGRLRRTVQEVAADLERGTPLPEAFERHRGQFPPLYGRLVEAGIRSNNLPSALLNLGRHLELVTRLRAVIWRAAAYPLFVMVGLIIVLLFLSVYVIPKFALIFRDFGVRLPFVTEVLLQMPRWLPPILIVLLCIILLPVLLWPFIRAAGRDQAVAEIMLLPLPMIGPVLKRNLVARWCDAVRIGADAGLDLPASIELAGNAVASRRLARDGSLIVDALRAGQPLDSVSKQLSLLPATVLAGIELASSHQDLPGTLATLSQMYQQQAEFRLNALPLVLTPLLVIVTALIVGFVIFAIFAPLIALLQAVAS